MAKIARLEAPQGKPHPGMEAYIFECPGCGMDHMIPVNYTDEYRKSCVAAGRSTPQWTFNGDLDKPTFGPSLLVTWDYGDKERKHNVCHSFVREGRIQFLSDCTHKMANMTVDLADV